MGTPLLNWIMVIFTSKYCGPWLRLDTKARLVDCTESPSMNICSELGMRVAKGGLDCFLVTSEEVMLTRLSVSMIMLKKPAVITQIIARERIPPVKVLY